MASEVAKWAPTAANALLIVIVGWMMGDIRSDVREIRTNVTSVSERLTDAQVKYTEQIASLQISLNDHFRNLEGQVHQINTQLTLLNSRLEPPRNRPTPR
jgi:predicted PurR-regulated permease PerM